MAGNPVWFGHSGRARFGMWHLPAGPTAVTAVVLCPPLGYEAVCAHAALRDLGESLAAEGVATLRLEYDGTGNSVGDDTDPDRVASWVSSVEDAVDHARSRGHEQVVLVGLRIGATLAAQAAAGNPAVSGLVLWDPAWSGRRYVRTLTMLAASGEAGGHLEGGVSLAGQVLTDEAMSGLRRLRVTPASLPGSALVLTAAERPGEEAPTDLPAGWQLQPVLGTAALLDTDVELAQVPEGILAEVVRWVAAAAGPDRPLPAPTAPAETVTEEETPEGRLRHEAVRVGSESHGDGLFAVVTSPADARPTAAVVMLNNGAAPQVGPGRVWVQWARHLAAREGLLVARLDLAGLGDSPPRDGEPVHETYPVGAGRDVAALTAALAARGVGDVAVLGLCSGALLGYDALLAAPEVRSVVSINARFDRPSVGRWRDRGWRATGRTSRVLAVPLSKTPLLPLLERLPVVVWRVLAWLHLVAPVSLPLRLVHERGARALLVFGEREWGWRALHRRITRGERERLLDDDLVRTVVVPGLDHSMFALPSRAPVYAAVSAFLRSTLRADAPGSGR